MHIQVFVTPADRTAPRWPARPFSWRCRPRRSPPTSFEAQEFPELAQRYQVRGVPMTVVNDGEPIMGNVGGARLLQAVLGRRIIAREPS